MLFFEVTNFNKKQKIARYIKISIIALDIGRKKAIPNRQNKQILSQARMTLVFSKFNIIVAVVKQSFDFFIVYPAFLADLGDL